MEIADSKGMYDMPLHPYTKALLSAIPVADIHVKKKRQILEGDNEHMVACHLYNDKREEGIYNE